MLQDARMQRQQEKALSTKEEKYREMRARDPPGSVRENSVIAPWGVRGTPREKYRMLPRVPTGTFVFSPWGYLYTPRERSRKFRDRSLGGLEPGSGPTLPWGYTSKGST